MKRYCTGLCASALLLFLVTAVGQDGDDGYVSFVACPVARHQGPWRDVCFIARHEGREYALRNPPDYGEPQLKHRILVEGRIVEGEEHCGAQLLDGRFSILREIDQNCNEIIPYTGPITDTPPPNLRRQGAYVSDDPQWAHLHPSVRPVMNQLPDLAVLPLPEGPPWQPQRQTIYYPFDSDRASGPDMAQLVQLVEYAVASNARFEIRSYQGQSLLDSGEVMTERPGMARQRAEKLRDILIGLGIDESRLTIAWEPEPIVGTGREDWRSRRIEVYLEP